MEEKDEEKSPGRIKKGFRLGRKRCNSRGRDERKDSTGFRTCSRR